MSTEPLKSDNSLEISEILPENGLIHTKLKEMHLLLCKPKILPVKSYTLEKLEVLEKRLSSEAKQRRQFVHSQREASAWKSAENLPSLKSGPDSPMMLQQPNESPTPTGGSEAMKFGKEMPRNEPCCEGGVCT
ncbi:unnamed protein product [Phytomonas sp. EM1]|nr:unnamed protein product [Phytomonas sp. EM1]|eukprot:CCW64048.1 unnamed protein product [Phytomonas sp. isolate EM1]